MYLEHAKHLATPSILLLLTLCNKLKEKIVQDANKDRGQFHSCTYR